MRISLLTRAAAITAIAATSALAVTGTADAASTPSRTSLSIRASASTIKPGKTAVVSGVLKQGNSNLAREVVYLDGAAPGKKFVVVGKSVTSKKGAVAFTVRPKSTERYELVFKGTSKLAASHSGVVTIKVS